MHKLGNITTVDHLGFGYPHEEEFGVMGTYTVIIALGQMLAMAIAPKDDKLSGGNLLLWLAVNPIMVYWVRAYNSICA